MGLSRRGGSRFQHSIWPGFVDAMTGLLLVLFFVITIFVVVQSMLSDQITGQETQLGKLDAQIQDLSKALGLAQQDSAALKDQVAGLDAQLKTAQDQSASQQRLIATLNAEAEARNKDLDTAKGRITDFQAQVASLLAAQDKLTSDAAKAADLAAAKQKELQALAAELTGKLDAAQAQAADVSAQLADKTKALSQAEKDRLAEEAAAAVLQQRLKDSGAELTAMTLSLEAERKKAEDTLTLLAGAEAAKKDLDAKLAAALADKTTLQEQAEAAQQSQADLQAQLQAALAAKLAAEKGKADAMTEAEQRATLLAAAQEQLKDSKAGEDKAAQQVALLNAQLTELRTQLAGLQGLLDSSDQKNSDSQVQINTLSGQLDTALARVAQEEKQRAALEEAARKKAEAEAKNLETYRSEFFGRLRQLIGNQPGVQIVGDRFVFSSEVLFDVGQADLSDAGRAEIGKVASVLQQVTALIPADIPWVLMVDGFTDDTPIASGGRFRDNWELSQARALSVVRYMIDNFGFPANRLAAAGFGQYQPVDPGDSAEARAKNRRIELKLTER